MVNLTRWRKHRVWSTACLTVCLAACGGSGGGGSISAPAGGSGGAASESSSLLADLELAADGSAALRVWDPTQPTVQVASFAPASPDTPVQYNWARSYDAATRTEHLTARTQAVYIGDGHVLQTDLRGGQSHTPRQLSSLDQVDATLSMVPVSLDGTTAWTNVRRAGVNYAVHSEMSSTAAPLSGLVMAALPGADGAGRYIAVSVPTNAGQYSLQIFSANGSGVAFSPLAGGTQPVYWVGFDPVQAGRAYVILNQTLRRLQWNESGVTLDPSYAYSLQAASSVYSSVSDAQGISLTDGVSLLRIEGDVLRTVGSFSHLAWQLWEAGDSVVARQDLPQFPICCVAYEAMDKATGAVKTINNGVNGIHVLGTAEGKALFDQAGVGWSLVSTQGQVLSQGNAPILGAVFAPDRTAARPAALQTFVGCAENPVVGQCDQVASFALDGTIQQVLGVVPTTTNLYQQQHAFIAGVPASLKSLSTQDLWQLTPGVANSLQGVTPHP